MWRHSHCWFVCLLVCVTGCEVLRPWNPQSWWSEADQKTATTPAAPDNAPLAGEAWQFQVAWTPRKEWSAAISGIPPASELRWKFPDWQRELRTAANTTDPAVPTPWMADETPSTSLLLTPPEIRNRQPLPLDTLQKLAQRDDLSGLNAVILLVQLQPESASAYAPRLERCVRKPASVDFGKPAPLTYSSRLRCAAAEAWCLALAHGEATSGSAAFKPVLELVVDPQLPDEVRAELFLGAARRYPPREIPWLANATQARSDADLPAPLVLRRAALQAVIVYAVQHPAAVTAAAGGLEESPLWPGPCHHLAQVPESSLRAGYGEMLAQLQHPQALDVLRQQTLDNDPHVQQRALRSIGLIQQDAARDFLRGQRDVGEDLRRIAVLEGLAAWGPPEMEPFARTSSVAVRIALVQAVRPHHSLLSQKLVREALATGNELRLEQAAWQTIQDWPRELATPVALALLQNATETTRVQVLDDLQKQRGESIEFPVRGTPVEREVAAQKLAERWLAQRPETPPAIATTAAASPVEKPSAPEWTRWLDPAQQPQSAGESVSRETVLANLSEKDLPEIEAVLAKATPEQADWLYREILPRTHPAYVALADLAQPNVQRRRDAAQNLLQHARLQPLPVAVWQRLAALMQREQDQQVWRQIMQLALLSPQPAAAELAHLAINHPWPDVRRLGCEYFTTHGRPEHAPWLLPLLNDSNSDIQRLALSAAAACGHPVVLDGFPDQPQPGGLRPWLQAENSQLRGIAATGMSRFGDFEGMQVLAELAGHSDWTVRRDAVRGMGDTGQSRFVEKLIGVIWTESNYTVKLTALDSLRRLVAPADWPAGLSTTTDYQQQITLWASWWSTRSQRAAAGTGQSRPPTSVSVPHGPVEQRLSNPMAR